MSDLTSPASEAVAQAGVYVAALMAALGSRDPLEVLDEMPGALSRAVQGLSPARLAASSDVVPPAHF